MFNPSVGLRYFDNDLLSQLRENGISKAVRYHAKTNKVARRVVVSEILRRDPTISTHPKLVLRLAESCAKKNYNLGKIGQCSSAFFIHQLKTLSESDKEKWFLYSINDPVALRSLLDTGWRPSDRFIDGIRFLNPKKKCATAFCLAEYWPSLLADSFRKLDIWDQTQRFQIAQKCCRSRRGFKAADLPHFDLSPEEERQILKELVCQPQNDVANHFLYRSHLSLEIKMEFARLDAQHNADYFCVENYKITDAGCLLELAQIARKHLKGVKGSYFANRFDQFKISDSGIRLDFAKRCFMVNSENPAFYYCLYKFRLSEGQLIEFYTYAAQYNLSALMNYSSMMRPVLFKKLPEEIKVRVLISYKDFLLIEVMSLSVANRLEVIRCRIKKSPNALLEHIRHIFTLQLPIDQWSSIILEPLVKLLKCDLLFIKNIVGLRDPKLKIKYIKNLLNFGSDHPIWEKMKGRTERAQLVGVSIFSYLAEFEINSELLVCTDNIMHLASSNKHLKDSCYLRQLLNHVDYLLHGIELTFLERVQLIEVALKNQVGQPKNNLMTAMSQLSILAAQNQVITLQRILYQEGVIDFSGFVQEAVEDSLRTICGAKDGELWPICQKVFNRNLEAPFIYWSKLDELPLTEKELAIAAFRKLVGFALAGTFQKERYRLEGSPHLQLIFATRPALFERWKKGFKIPLQTLVSLSNPSVMHWKAENFVHWLQEKVFVDGHMPDLKDSSHFAIYFTQDPRSDELGRKMLDRLSRIENPTVVQQLERLCIQLCMEATLDKEGVLKKITELPQAKKSLGQFFVDVSALSQQLSFKGHQKDISRYVCEDTDDFQTLFLMGNVTDSCQRTSGDPKYSKGLLGILNGRNRVLAVTDDGEVLARAIIRVLYDVDLQEPVLLLERVYNSRPTETVFNNALIQLAKRRAEELGLYLVVSGEEKTRPIYPGRVVFAEDVAPFEYSDSDRTIHQGSKSYTLADLRLLYTPSQKVPLPEEGPGFWDE